MFSMLLCHNKWLLLLRLCGSLLNWLQMRTIMHFWHWSNWFDHAKLRLLRLLRTLGERSAKLSLIKEIFNLVRWGETLSEIGNLIHSFWKTFSLSLKFSSCICQRIICNWSRRHHHHIWQRRFHIWLGMLLRHSQIIYRLLLHHWWLC